MIIRILIVIITFSLTISLSAYSCEEPFSLKGSAEFKNNIKSCEVSAKNGSSIAKHNLAIHFIKGYGTEKNGKAGIDLLIQASNESNMDSQLMLSLLYLNNNEFKNPNKAIPWLKQLATKEHSYALFLLGELYAEGEFVAQDLPLAKDLLSRSNLPESKELLSKLNEPDSNWFGYFKDALLIIVVLVVISFLRNSPSGTKKKPRRKSASKSNVKATKKVIKNIASSSSNTKKSTQKTKKLHTHPYHCAWCHITATASSFLIKNDCINSPSGKHEAIPTPTTGECRYCGNRTDTFVNGRCTKSPYNNRHALKEN